MVQESPRRPPDLSECAYPVEPAITNELRSTWRARHGSDLDLRAHTGSKAAAVVVVVGTPTRAHELFVFARGPGSGLAGPLAAAIDAADALLLALAADERRPAPLDWQGETLGDHVVFVRGERRDYCAEEEAARLLGEEPPPRGLPGFPMV